MSFLLKIYIFLNIIIFITTILTVTVKINKLSCKKLEKELGMDMLIC